MLGFKQFIKEGIEHGSFKGRKSPDVKALAKVSHKFLFHSGTSDQLHNMKHELSPQHGDWIKEIANGAADNPHEVLERSTPLVWLSDKPNWVHMKVARKLKKTVGQVTDDDVKNHGHVALVPRKGDHAEHIWHVGQEGLQNGPYSKVTNLNGEERHAYHTDLYDYDDIGQKEPFGVERNEYVSARSLEPMVHLTGQHLVDFLQHVRNNKNGK